MQQTEHQAIIDLLPAYALNSLDAEEAEMVHQHLASCPQCQGELSAFEAVVDALPLAAPEIEPPAALKGQLMRQIQAAPHGKTAVASQPAPSPWQRFTAAWADFWAGPRWQPVAVLVILVALIAGFLIWRQLNPPTSQYVLTPTEAAPGAQGVIEVVGNGREAILSVTGLPELDPARQYQLWLIKDGQRTSGGVFSVEADGSQNITINAPQPLADYAAFGITIEPAGGSPGPTGERVLGFNL